MESGRQIVFMMDSRTELYFEGYMILGESAGLKFSSEPTQKETYMTEWFSAMETSAL